MQHTSKFRVSIPRMTAFWQSFTKVSFALITVALAAMLSFLHNPAMANSAGFGLPLLQPGQHMGVHAGISPNHPDLQLYWQDALNAGMDTQVIAFNWVDLEPTKGTYNKHLLEEQLSQAGLELTTPMLMLTGPQSDEMALPHDLDGQEGFELRHGRSIDDPVIIDRYKRLLDWVIPMLSAHNGWAIVVGNEVDLHLQEEPSDVFAYLEFLRAARDHVHSISPDMAVAMSVTAGPVYLADPVALSFIDESDFASYTLYCDVNWSGMMELVLDFYVMPYLQAGANDKPIVFQEFGCSSGFVDGRQQTIGHSPEIQEEFIEAFISVVDRTPQVRAAYAYQLSDLSTAQVDYYLSLADYLNSVEEKEYWTQHIELLGTLGLCENDSGETKPGWEKLVEGIGWVR